MVGIDLTGKTALITGSGQGLGEATARLFHQAGANVVINYFSEPSGLNQERAEKVAESLGERAIVIEADVRDADSVQQMFKTALDTFGAIDFVVNNAGVIRDKSIKKMERADWDMVISVNLTGVFNVCKAAAECLAEHGRIVNLSSISGLLGFFGQANYSASKAGVIGLTKVLSKELARRSITVNAVAPGVVLTEMGLSIPENYREEMLKQIPLARFGTANDIANAILFLCSDLGAYISGQVIHVNGGWA